VVQGDELNENEEKRPECGLLISDFR
jgi:hypothetical protein